MDASSSRAPLVVHKKVCKRGQLAIWRPTGEGEAGKRKRGIAFLGVDGKKGRKEGGLRGKSNLYTREKRANGEDDIGRKIFPWRFVSYSINGIRGANLSSQRSNESTEVCVNPTLKHRNAQERMRSARNNPLLCPRRNGNAVRLLSASLNYGWCCVPVLTGENLEANPRHRRKRGRISQTRYTLTERVGEGHDRTGAGPGMGFPVVQGQQICKCNNGKEDLDATTESTIQFGGS